MNILHVIILGIVEGLTEFLPISSTFHLIFASKLLHIPDTDFLKLFEVVIQGGAILAVLILYLKELATNRDLLMKVIVSFIPTAIVGFILEKVIKNVFFESTPLMLGAFIVVGLVFFLIEYLIKKDQLKLEKNTTTLTYRDAFIIGLVQAFAVVPGVSRAGAVIVGMMFLGYKRVNAAKYSFMLSIPTILAASGLELLKMHKVLFSSGSNVVYLLLGSVVAFICAYGVVRWFIDYLKHHSLNVFGAYRILLVIIILLLLKLMSP